MGIPWRRRAPDVTCVRTGAQKKLGIVPSHTVGKGRTMAGAGAPSSQQSKVAYLATHELIKIFSNQRLLFGQIWFVALLKYNNTKHTDRMYAVLGTVLGPSPAFTIYS